MQPAYLIAVAEVSARLADTAGTARWLTRLADLGGSVKVDAVEGFRAVRDAPALAAVRRRLEANLAPLVRSDSVAGIPDPEFYPEGVDYDAASGAWFVASVRRRTVARIGRDGSVTEFPKLGTERMDAVLGVRVDARHGVLWATTRVLPAMAGYRPEDGTRARVWAFSLASGELLGVADAATDGPHLFGDLVVHSSGDVYVSDSESPILFRARLTGGRVVLEERLRHRLFRSLQGLAFSQDEHLLYLADYAHGLLLVDLGKGTVRSLEAPAGVGTLGLDGIARSGRMLVGVQNGSVPPRITGFRLSGDGLRITGSRVLDRHLPLADEPTIGTLAGGRFVYVANSQWEKYDEKGQLKPGAALAAPVLLAVPVDR
jgi:hypothetical protein